MKSMTGFGNASVKGDGFDLSVDISSVNKKGFELSAYLPRQWQAMERLVAQEIKNCFTRGKITVRVSFNSEVADSFADSVIVKQKVNKLAQICKDCGVSFNPDAKLILELASSSSMTSDYSSDQTELWWDILRGVIAEALSKMDAMRIQEGEALKKDTLERLENILSLVNKIDSLRSSTVEDYKQRLLQKLSDMGLALDLNDERVLKEVCIFADKVDIAEEITRLNSHIEQFKSSLNSTEASGRKMDFICQEMGRESNTIASKSNNLEITRAVIDIKNELERIREQIQNVE